MKYKRHKYIVSFFVALLLLVISTHSTHAAMRVEILAKPTHVSVGDTIRLSIVTFLSGETKPVGVLQVSDISGMQAFEILHSGQSVQTQTEMVDGEQFTQQATVFRYDIQATQPGEYTIGPFSVETNEGPISSNQVSIVVSNEVVLPGADHEMNYWIGIGICIVIILLIVGALVRVFSTKKNIPLKIYSKQEMISRSLECEDADSLFFLLQDILAHEHGEGIRTSTIEEIIGLSQNTKLTELLQLFLKYRFAEDTQKSMDELQSAFNDYIQTYDD